MSPFHINSVPISWLTFQQLMEGNVMTFNLSLPAMAIWSIPFSCQLSIHRTELKKKRNRPSSITNRLQYHLLIKWSELFRKKKKPYEELIPEGEFGECLTQARIYSTHTLSMYTHTHMCTRVCTHKHTLWLGLFLLYCTVDPGALLYEEPDQSNSADPGRRKR